MHLVIGLGNPGEKYKNSRHNVGFILLDEILKGAWESDKYSNSLWQKDSVVIFVKPQTFMNNSGISAKHLSDKYEVAPSDVITIHDDIDLPFGQMKIVFESGPGGHNGTKSIIENLGTNKFVRIKIGIAPIGVDGKAMKPKPGLFQSQKGAVSRYVLKDFSKGDIEKLKTLAPRVKEIIDTIIQKGYLEAMNKFN